MGISIASCPAAASANGFKDRGQLMAYMSKLGMVRANKEEGAILSIGFVIISRYYFNAMGFFLQAQRMQSTK